MIKCHVNPQLSYSEPKPVRPGKAWAAGKGIPFTRSTTQHRRAGLDSPWANKEAAICVVAFTRIRAASSFAHVA